MQEWIYRYQRNGYYLSNLSDTGYFGAESRAVLRVEPCDYSLEVSGQILNRVQCSGYRIEITDQGAAAFYDLQGQLLVQMESTHKQFKGFRLQWQPDALTICFGQMETVDNYPNCDGESDRWEEKWVTQYRVEWVMV